MKEEQFLIRLFVQGGGEKTLRVIGVSLTISHKKDFFPARRNVQDFYSFKYLSGSRISTQFIIRHKIDFNVNCNFQK